LDNVLFMQSLLSLRASIRIDGGAGSPGIFVEWCAGLSRIAI
jgi:hypothetical protein